MGVASLPEAWEEVWGDYEILRGRSLSLRTLANYRDTFVQLAKFVGPEAPTLESLNRRQIAAFLDRVTQTTSATTAAMRYRGLSAVFRSLSKPDDYGEALLGRNPMAGVTPPKSSDVLFPLLSVDGTTRLLAACRGTGFEGIRDEAIIRFMYDTGCRLGEVASMQIDPQWLNLHAGTATVTGKTRPRIVAFGPKTRMAILRYQRVRRRGRWRTDPALWVGRRGGLKGNGVYQALKERYRRAGMLDVKKKAHIFRHTFSHEWRLKGGQIDDLVALNGWKSVP